MGLKRTDIPWREWPHLRIEEAVALSGLSRRTVTNAIKSGDLNTRRVGEIPVIPTRIFRVWIGEPVEIEADSAAYEPRIEAKAERILRRVR